MLVPAQFFVIMPIMLTIHQRLKTALILIILIGSTQLLHAEPRYDTKSIIIKTKTQMVTKSVTLLDAESFKTQSWGLFSRLPNYPTKIKRLSRIQRRSNPQVLSLHFDTNQDIKALITQLKSDPNVITAEPNLIYQIPETQFTPNDPLVSEQYHLDLLHMPEAWNISSGNADVTIAIIDTGIDINHPDLKNQFWQNTPEVNGFTGIDDDNNGKIDDKYGWNFNAESTQINDVYGHGTHVSGIAAAQVNNGIGVAGIAFNCKIMSLKTNVNDSDSFYVEDLIAALNYATEMQVDVINMSLGGSGQSPLFNEAIEDAYDAGIVVVVAAGNEHVDIENADISPAIHPDVITVAAADSTGEVDSRYSNYGDAVDILAPGTSIYSTYPPSSYQTLTGTSMATPIVTGVVALLKSIYQDATPTQIYNAITKSALDKGRVGKDSRTGYGLIQPAAALNYLKRPDTYLKRPNTKCEILSGDYIKNDQLIEYSFISISPINESSIVATINQNRYTTSSPELSFTPLSGNPSGKLTIDLSTIPLTSELHIQLYYEDSKGDHNTDTINLVIKSGFQIDGPSGEGSKLINAPNPFDPDRESTTIGFQSTQSAMVNIDIYSLNLAKVFEWPIQVTAGYQGIKWDGKDLSGNTLPNGVYILTLNATSDSGETIKKQHKIAISRRKSS